MAALLTPIGAVAEIEQVQVTALRRSVPLQKVPASIVRIDGAALRAAGATTLAEAAKLVGNFDFNENFRPGASNLAMRGVPTATTGEAPVQVLVDGVQAPGPDFIDIDLIDISDIEVLRGPQGALYGRGAIAGAVVVNTVQPTSHLHDDAVLDYGNGNTIRVANVLSGPLLPDVLLAKATVQYKASDGLIEDLGLHRPGDFYHEINGALELRATPAEGTTLVAQGSHLRGLDGASLQNIVPAGGIGDFTSYQPDRNLPVYDNRRIDDAVLKWDQVTPNFSLSSISQYARAASRLDGDGDFTAAPVAVQMDAIRVRAINQDLRLTSPAGRQLQWMLGGFVQWRDTRDLLVVSREEPGLLPPGPDFARADEAQTSHAYAAYAQTVLALPRGLTLTTGLRYDIDRRRDVARDVPGSAIAANFAALQPSATLSAQFSPAMLGYATIGRGFRSGGFNALQDTLNFPALVRRAYPTETVTNYEAGTKTSLAQGLLVLNASVFVARYSYEQFYFASVTPPSRDIISLGRVTIPGGELGLTWRPLARFTLTGELGLALATIDSADPGLADHGRDSPNANRYNGAVDAEYRPVLSATLTGLAQVTYSALGPIRFDPANRFGYHATAYLDARIGLQRAIYGCYLWGRNLTDTRYPTIFVPDAFGPGIGARLDNLPATYGFELTASL